MVSQTSMKDRRHLFPVPPSSYGPYFWSSCYSANHNGRVASQLGVTDRGEIGGQEGLRALLREVE